MDIIQTIKQNLMGMNITMEGHYGQPTGTQEKQVQEILIEIIKEKDYSKVIDKQFSQLGAEDRLKVQSYAEAMYKYNKMTGALP